MANAYPELEKRFERMSLLREACTALQWDAATYMPDGGAGARGDQTALLRVLGHETLVAPDMGDLLAKAETETRTEWERANLREMKREWRRATAVPASLVRARSQAVSACEMRWRTARKENDFASLLPSFEEVLRRTRETADAVGSALGLSPYDALLDEWEPGGRSAEIDSVFETLEGFLPALVGRVIEQQSRRPRHAFPVGPFPAERQLALAKTVMTALGFDFDHGRIDTSAHPFCDGIRDDIRVTTRWDESDFTTGLFGVIHETGHALYVRGLPARFGRQPVGQARGMSTHESQSLLWEMQAARSPEFLSFLSDHVRTAFGGEGPEWSGDALLAHMLRVERSLIRVNADEVTYPLHIILRYRLERAMIAGDLTLRDLPLAFADGMEKLVGIRPTTVADGCLQDIHWPDGAWGYFPTYTVGALTAAQLFEQAARAIPTIRGSLEKGETAPLLAWLQENVHSMGSSASPSEIIVRATGRALDPQVFRKHLEDRYLNS